MMICRTAKYASRTRMLTRQPPPRFADIDDIVIAISPPLFIGTLSLQGHVMAEPRPGDDAGGDRAFITAERYKNLISAHLLFIGDEHGAPELLAEKIIFEEAGQAFRAAAFIYRPDARGLAINAFRPGQMPHFASLSCAALRQLRRSSLHFRLFAPKLSPRQPPAMMPCYCAAFLQRR